MCVGCRGHAIVLHSLSGRMGWTRRRRKGREHTGHHEHYCVCRAARSANRTHDRRTRVSRGTHDRFARNARSAGACGRWFHVKRGALRRVPVTRSQRPVRAVEQDGACLSGLSGLYGLGALVAHSWLADRRCVPLSTGRLHPPSGWLAPRAAPPLPHWFAGTLLGQGQVSSGRGPAPVLHAPPRHLCARGLAHHARSTGAHALPHHSRAGTCSGTRGAP